MGQQSSTRRQLEAGEVHVWTHRQAASGSQENQRLLSQDERRRAARFQFPHLAATFIDIHGWMRRVLASYTGTLPESLVFLLNDFGKPSLPPGAVSPCFNLSHTEGLALLAVCHGAQIGVDVELLRPVPEADSIAATHFSAAEREAQRAAPATVRDRVFLRCWTRKEALLKAWGTGISTNLATFTVSTSSEDTAALLHCDWSPVAPRRWTLAPLHVGAGYLAALAVAGPAREVRYLSGLEGSC